MRINKLLSNRGYCSRRETNRWIEAQRLTVNGKLCQQGQWLEEGDEVLLDGEPIEQKERVYLAFHKPKGIRCTSEIGVQNTAIHYVSYHQYVFPVGRLDQDSEGLLLLTNDGTLAHHILSADNSHEKEYTVTVHRPINEAFLEQMACGVALGTQVTRPCTLKQIGSHSFSIVLTQGLNRQIRRMCQAFGYKVVQLKRVRIMAVTLGTLPVGECRALTQTELEALKTTRREGGMQDAVL